MHGRLFSDLIQVSKRETLTTLGSRRGGGVGGRGRTFIAQYPTAGHLREGKIPITRLGVGLRSSPNLIDRHENLTIDLRENSEETKVI